MKLFFLSLAFLIAVSLNAQQDATDTFGQDIFQDWQLLHYLQDGGAPDTTLPVALDHDNRASYLLPSKISFSLEGDVGTAASIHYKAFYKSDGVVEDFDSEGTVDMYENPEGGYKLVFHPVEDDNVLFTLYDQYGPTWKYAQIEDGILKIEGLEESTASGDFIELDLKLHYGSP